MELKVMLNNKKYFYGFLISIQVCFFFGIIKLYDLTESFLVVSKIIYSLLYPVATFIIIYLILKSENQNNEIQKIKEHNLELRKQRHDFLNHLEVISGLIDFNEIDEAKKYLELIEASVKIKSLIDKINNPYMSIIISSYAKKAEAKGVRFELYGFSDFSKFPLSPTHTTTIMSNLLKNSLENCEANGCIYIETEIIHNYFYLKISNDGKPIEIIHGENPSDWDKQIYQGKSTKGKDRGAGMLIIKEILSQYEDCNLCVLNRKNPSFMLKLKIIKGVKEND